MGTSASFARKALSCLAAALLAFTLVPAGAFAGQENVESSVEEPQEANSAQVDEAAGALAEADGSTPAASSTEGGTLVASLTGRPASFVSADVLLDSEPVIGSFIVDGLAFAVVDESTVELVGVSRAAVAGSTPAASEAEADAPTLLLPESIAYGDVGYSVISIGAYAFYLSGVTSVELPDSIVDVDDRAFRSSDVASVTVAEGNPTYSSFDGALYSADRSSLLLIPEGKQGAVLLPKGTEVAEAGKFSHCSLVDAIFAEDGAAFASENGLLYTSDLTTLLRVPAGATEITIREGCTTIAAGAMEGCAHLTTINAPSSVTSISSDVFTSVPTISLPAATLAEDAPQLTALVALSTTDSSTPEVRADRISVLVPSKAEASIWQSAGFAYVETSEEAAIASSSQEASAYGADGRAIQEGYSSIVANGGIITIVHYKGDGTYYGTWQESVQAELKGYTFSGNGTSWTYTNNTTWRGTGSVARTGYTFAFWGSSSNAQTGSSSFSISTSVVKDVYAIWNINVAWDPNGGTWGSSGDAAIKSESWLHGKGLTGPAGTEYPQREGYRFLGWAVSPDDAENAALTVTVPNEHVAYYAQWKPIEYNLGFDVDSEPGDEDYPGVGMPDQTVAGEQVGTGDKVEIEGPKRPGYVFQGWVIPGADGEHAIDQELVYKDEADGKWYVDASKLPDYADDSGRVELTARWTSAISVDVPSAATFYYDLVTDQSSEAHEAALSGTTSFSSRSQVDLRVCGLESVKAAGADALFSSGADGALLSVYPAADGSATTVEDAQGPAGEKPSTAVDFSLDDIVLEAAFAKAGADAFSIPAGDDLTLSYRLNLGEGASLDYDKVLAMAEGDEASLASISYCFAADSLPVFWTYDDDGRMLNVYAIKDDAEAIAAGDADAIAKYTAWMNADHRFYVRWFDKGVSESDAKSEDDSMVYEVRIIGINHDTKADGSGTAGITFEFVNLLIDPYCMNFPTCGTVDHYGNQANVFNSANKGHEFDTWDTYTVSGTYTHNMNSGGWGKSLLRAQMNPGIETNLNVGSVGLDNDAIWKDVPEALAAAIVPVKKSYFDNSIGFSGAVLRTSSDSLFLLSLSEVVANTRTFPSGWSGLISEGSVYQFYANHQTIGNGDNAILIKYRTYPDGSIDDSPYSWWFRSANPSYRTSFAHISIDGEPHTAVQPVASYMLGTAPCFAL